jgi:hypothetical protein
MIWQLLQVQHLQKTPLILVGNMWAGLVEWARTALLSFDPPLASPEEIDIPQCVRNADEAIALIRYHHAQRLQEWAKHTANRLGGEAVCACALLSRVVRLGTGGG